jgi:hypothetical protein
MPDIIKNGKDIAIRLSKNPYMAYAILLALMFSWNWGTCILRDRLFLGLGHLGVTVLGSDGNDLKSIDFKSWFQITFLICDFDLKSLFSYWFVILIWNHFFSDFDFELTNYLQISHRLALWQGIVAGRPISTTIKVDFWPVLTSVGNFINGRWEHCSALFIPKML